MKRIELQVTREFLMLDLCQRNVGLIVLFKEVSV